MNYEFKPTHIITTDSGERIPVMLIDGAAYTEVETESLTPADYERQENGDWTFQGQPFNGTVEVI